MGRSGKSIPREKCKLAACNNLVVGGGNTGRKGRVFCCDEHRKEHNLKLRPCCAPKPPKVCTCGVPIVYGKWCPDCRDMENALRRYDTMAHNLERRKSQIRVCKTCGQEFKPALWVTETNKRNRCGGKIGKYCPDCRSIGDRSERMGVPYEAVNPSVVFARDGWKCQHCGKPTPKDLTGTVSPDSPTLDHVLPLSKGGAHSYANTQCLCRDCNNKKKETAST